MSQNDFTIANQSFPAFRADLNSALQALATNNSGGSAPSTTFANMWWYDTSNNIMYIRNEDNDAWIKFAELDQANDKFVLSGTLQLDDGTVSAPALTFNSDTNMGIYRGGTDILKFVTAGTDAITIDASQLIGIGTSSPSSYNSSFNNLVVADAGDSGITIVSGTSSEGSIAFADGTTGADAYRGWINYNHFSNYMRISTNGSEAMRIDNNGNVGIGTSSPSGLLHLSANTATTTLPSIVFQDTGTTSTRLGSLTNNNGDLVLAMTSSLTDLRSAITLADDRSMNFATNGVEAMRITSSGAVLVGTTVENTNIVGHGFFDYGFAFHTTSGSQVLAIIRQSDDGTLISLRQDNVEEGNISVSGTTISYNGGHLSRWSQLADNTRDNTIVKGTVMTNLDQMAEWTTDGVTEDNEQLNCMAVSSVEGDANVAGVFVNWDNDDDIYTNDMNIAMTGDMVIRIAQGTTVARGDLLMSAGDGTAKPQGDDIVRSKTIAKVTSTNVSHTYDDGTYLVPCVLMAC